MGNYLLTSEAIQPTSGPWYTQWFNSAYFDVYSHRTVQQASIEVESLLELIPDVPRERVLDIASGNGRHLLSLSEYFRFSVGVELSSEALARARTNLDQAASSACLLRADFRSLPFPDGHFSLATNFFTSFGYLDTDREHLSLLREWRRVLSATGCLMLDFLNRETVLSGLQAHSVQQRSGFTIEEFRAFRPEFNRLEKRIVLHAAGKPPQTYLESIRLYSRADLQALLHESGFSVKAVYGDFNGEEYRTDSPRLIFRANAG